MSFEEINQKAWETAAQAVMLKNGKIEAYSKKQIRGFFELAKSKNFEKDLEVHIYRYSPQPSGGQKPHEFEKEKQKMKEINEIIGKRIMDEFKKYNTAERMRFAQYLMWDIKILESFGIEKVQFILECEKVKSPKPIIDILVSKTEVQPTRKSDMIERRQRRR